MREFKLGFRKLLLLSPLLRTFYCSVVNNLKIPISCQQGSGFEEGPCRESLTGNAHRLPSENAQVVVDWGNTVKLTPSQTRGLRPGRPSKSHSSQTGLSSLPFFPNPHPLSPWGFQNKPVMWELS